VQRRRLHLLVAAVFVRSRGSPDHMSGRRLPDSLRHESGQDGDVQDVAGGDEGVGGRGREPCETRDGLLRGDECAVDVDGRVAAELGEGDREGIVGESEVRYADYTCVSRSVDGRRGRLRLTVVYYDAGDSERLLCLIKGVDYIFGLGEIARDVQQAVTVVGFFDGAGSEGDFVALGSKDAGNRLANVGACTENEDDGDVGGHDSMLGCLKLETSCD
jgi:hypothetical protein